MDAFGARSPRRHAIRCSWHSSIPGKWRRARAPISALLDANPLDRSPTHGNQPQSYLAAGRSTARALKRVAGAVENSANAIAEEVGEPIMRPIAVILVALVLFMPRPVFAQEWTEFASREDGFKVDFPGPPKVQDTTFTSEYRYTLPARVYSVERGRERYSMTVVDYNGIEAMGKERVKTCPPGAEPCHGSMNTGEGYWKMDRGGAIVYAAWTFLQRDVKLTHLMWKFMDLVEASSFSSPATLTVPTFVHISIHLHKLYILEQPCLQVPEPGCFSSPWATSTKTKRDSLSVRLHDRFPPPPLTAWGAGLAERTRGRARGEALLRQSVFSNQNRVRACAAGSIRRLATGTAVTDRHPHPIHCVSPAFNPAAGELFSTPLSTCLTVSPSQRVRHSFLGQLRQLGADVLQDRRSSGHRREHAMRRRTARDATVTRPCHRGSAAAGSRVLQEQRAFRFNAPDAKLSSSVRWHRDASWAGGLSDLYARAIFVVANDAATLPASLFGVHLPTEGLSNCGSRRTIRCRLTRDIFYGRRVRAGDFRTPTEHRRTRPSWCRRRISA